MYKKTIVLAAVFLLSGFTENFFVNSVYPQIRAEDVSYSGPSDVYVSGTQLMVRKRLSDSSLAEAKPYSIKGVTYSPATNAPKNGPNPDNPLQAVQYGFFFDWSGRDPQGHKVMNYWMKNQFKERYLEDIPLMKQMNINTVRVYGDFGEDPVVYEPILDEFYRNGIMVIMTVAVSKEDLELQDNNTKHYELIVELYKSHPVILMWLLGNEWNLEYNKYYGYATVTEAAQATELAAKKIKELDVNHPVSSCLGDRFSDPDTANRINEILRLCPSVDVWGINVYRGESFGEPDIFTQWQAISSKPFYFSEFGTDSFKTSSYDSDNVYQAYNCQGKEDQAMAAEFIVNHWDEINKHLSAYNVNEICLGGLVHEFNDELWKVGNYNVSLGGLVDYDGADDIDGNSDDDHSYDDYNTEGFIILGGHPDGISNEEYYGVVDAQRNPKKSFFALQQIYAENGTVDSTAPKTTALGIDGLWHNSSVTVTLKAEDTDSGVDKTYYSIDGSAPSLIYTGPFIISNEGIFSIKYYSLDKAGNVEAVQAAPLEVKIDKTVPLGTVKINNDDSYANTASVTLKFSAQDTLSGMGMPAQLKISNFNPSDWSVINAITYTDNTAWNLSSGDCLKTVYVKFKDAAGNWSNVVSDSIILDRLPPVIVHSPIASASKNRDIVFAANVTDAGSGVQEVSLFWRKWIWKWGCRWSELRKESLILQPDKSYTAVLTGRQTGCRKIKYYIRAQDKLGKVSSTPTYTIKRN